MEKDRSLLALVFYNTSIALLYMPFYSLFFEGWNKGTGGTAFFINS